MPSNSVNAAAAATANTRRNSSHRVHTAQNSSYSCLQLMGEVRT